MRRGEPQLLLIPPTAPDKRGFVPEGILRMFRNICPSNHGQKSVVSDSDGAPHRPPCTRSVPFARRPGGPASWHRATLRAAQALPGMAPCEQCTLLPQQMGHPLGKGSSSGILLSSFFPNGLCYKKRIKQPLFLSSRKLANQHPASYQRLRGVCSQPSAVAPSKEKKPPSTGYRPLLPGSAGLSGPSFLLSPRVLLCDDIRSGAKVGLQ